MTRIGLFAIVSALLVVWVASSRRTYQDFTPATDRPAQTSSPPPFNGSGQSVSGRVIWTAGVPTVPPVRGLITTADGVRWGEMPNHFAPEIDPESGGLAGAVVFLKQVGVGFDGFPSLTVEQRDFRVQVRQSGRVSQVGFVRTGDEVELSAHDPKYHSLRARGAAFFTLVFPEGSAPLRRRLDRPGHVEFTSAAGYFWSAADVFVCDHPYYTVTDAAGRFELADVPPGEYELVAWARNWGVIDRDRDPETGRIMRLKFADPFTVTAPVRVTADSPSRVNLRLPG